LWRAKLLAARKACQGKGKRSQQTEPLGKHNAVEEKKAKRKNQKPVLCYLPGFITFDSGGEKKTGPGRNKATANRLENWLVIERRDFRDKKRMTN